MDRVGARSGLRGLPLDDGLAELVYLAPVAAILRLPTAADEMLSRRPANRLAFRRVPPILPNMQNIIRSGVLGIVLSLSSLALVPSAHALDFGKIAKGAVKDGANAAGNAARQKVLKEVNIKLLADARKNQCSFKSDSDELAPGCDSKVKRLTSALVEAKKRLNTAGVTTFKFEVSGHTDSKGKDEHNKALSGKRAAVIVKELVARGIAKSEIESVAMGATKLLVSPDNTPAKQAKNRRYEIRVRS